MARRGLLWGVVVVLAAGIGVGDAVGGDGPGPLGGIGALADHGERVLERLPWDAHIVRANLSKRAPMSIAAAYLMSKQLLVVSQAGRIYCLDRGNLEPRWVNTLRYPLARPPSEGPTHYAFLMKDQRGAFWLETISKRSGAQGDRFPVRLPYSASSGVAVGTSMVFVGSLGEPGSNKTVESVNLVTGRRGWGYHSSGMLFGDPQLDPSSEILLFAGDDGVVTALPAAATAPSKESWIRALGGSVRGSVAVTPSHVLVGNEDGVLYNLDLFSGKVNWLQGLDEAIRQGPWVLGGTETLQKSTGVEGAAPVAVSSYTGLAFARNVKGLHAFDLASGDPAFQDAAGGRPLLRHGKYVLTVNGARKVTIRDASDGYKVTGSLNLGMFDLIPTNGASGELYACTSDGNVVAAVPK